MMKEKFYIGSIPAVLWGPKFDKIYILVHGKMSNKESAEAFVSAFPQTDRLCRRMYKASNLHALT